MSDLQALLQKYSAPKTSGRIKTNKTNDQHPLFDFIQSEVKEVSIFLFIALISIYFLLENCCNL